MEGAYLPATMDVRVPSQINPYRIYGVQTGSGIIFFSEHFCFAPSLYNINHQFSILIYLSYHGLYIIVATDRFVK
jgi:hypothetical protein